MRKIFLLSIVVLFFASCDSVQEPMSQKPIHFHKDYKETALVFGTVTFTDERPEHEAYYLYFEAIDDDTKAKRKNSSEIILYIKPGKSYDGDMNQNKTYLFAMEKKPGKYKISRIRSADLYFNVVVAVANELETPTFEIKKGEIAYVGELQFNHKTGLKTPKVTNAYERDIAAFKKSSAFVNWDTATNKTE